MLWGCPDLLALTTHIADTCNVCYWQFLHACAQVAKLELELDDAYDDLEPILRGIECKDQYVRPPPSHTLYHLRQVIRLLRAYISTAPGGIVHVTFQTWQHAAPGTGQGKMTDMHVVCEAGLPRLGEGQSVRGQPDHDAGRHRLGPRLPQVLQALLRKRSHPGLPLHATSPSCT